MRLNGEGKMKVFDYISLIACGTAFGMASFLLVKLLTKDRKPWTSFFVLVLACLYGVLGYITAGVVYNYVHKLSRRE
jgi:H+/Cl- antiporter ClcA